MAVAIAPEQVLDLALALEHLVDAGLVARADANLLAGGNRTREQSLQHPLIYVAAQQVGNAARPGRVLDLETLTQWLGETAQLPVLRIDPLKVKVAEVARVMSFEFAKRHGILCVEASAEEIVVATAQPFVTTWVSGLEQASRKRIKRVVANPADIEKYTLEFYTLSRSVSGAGTAMRGTRPALSNFEQLLELGSLKDPDAQDQHIVNIVDWLLQYAFDQRASDIHIEPRRELGKVRFRIDGVLHPVYELPAQVLSAVTSRLKILGRMNVAEKRKPQDGRVKTRTPAGGEVELRLSTLPTAFGEKLVIRIFDPEVLLRSFIELGLSGEDYQRWQGMVGQPNGIVLVTGPTGSGKTTTLYSTLKQLATEEVNVSTVEDPIEMVEDSFNQTQVQPQINFSFAEGVRTLMRQDPDIIMVGEIRDLATAEMAIQAALTGHLVLSTLHTNDAPTAITRLLDLGVPAHLLKVTLNGVMAQRLVRTLCPHCARKTPVDMAAWKALVQPWKAPPPAQFAEPGGCLECRDTGYLGRQGIYEIMLISETLKPLIGEQCDISALRLQAMREGMRTLRLSGAQKVGAGITSVAEVMRVAPDMGR
ncbi:MAG: type II/IV secretion system protein [Gammaproteobacteria bacterium]|nr:type II/IV secretion system protein [Gammaproteobacteria bacterium]